METRVIFAVLTAFSVFAVVPVGLGHHSVQTHAQPAKTNKVKDKSVVVPPGVPAAASGKPFGSHLEPILKVVSASDEQRKAITEITEDFKTRIEPLRKKHDELRDQFLNSLSSGQSSETIMANQAEFNRAQGELHAQYLALRLKVMKVLTADQNQKFQEYRKQQGWNSN